MSKNTKNKTFTFMINTFFVLICFPFVSLYPIGTDVQPIVFIMAALIVFCLFYNNRFFLDKTDLFFLFVSTLSFVYFIDVESEFVIRKRVGLLFAFLIYYLTKRFHLYFKFKVFYWSVVVNFICGLFHFLLPSLFVTTLGRFVRVIKVLVISGQRGISGLAPEPGFLGAMGVFFLAILLYFCKREAVNKKDICVLVFMAVTLIILTKSGTGYLLLMMFVMFWGADQFRMKRLFIYLTLGIGAVWFVYQYGGYFSGRGYSILHLIITNPSALLFDESVSYRLSNVYVAIYSLFEHPFGSGVGTFRLTAEHVYNVSDVGTLINPRRTYTVSVSAFSQYIVEMGLLFLVFIGHIFYIGKKSLFTMLLCILSFMFLLGSFSILFPPTWFCLAIASNFKNMQNHSRLKKVFNRNRKKSLGLS